MLRPGERNRLEEGINYFPAGAPRRTLFFTLGAMYMYMYMYSILQAWAIDRTKSWRAV